MTWYSWRYLFSASCFSGATWHWGHEDDHELRPFKAWHLGVTGLNHRHNEVEPEPPEAEGGSVVPFARPDHSDRSWCFASDVRFIGGTEGEWLQKEIAGVVRDLLLWAHQDMHRSEAPDDRGDDQAAA
jgi:hypothetical protein